MINDSAPTRNLHAADAKRPRARFIDDLRGAAAIMVVVQHIGEIVVMKAAAPATLVAALNGLLIETINLGRFGVVLFFLISGYVIPFSFREPSALRGFALSRLTRLYPAYWLSIAAMLAALAVSGGQMPSGIVILANLTMLQTYLREPDVVTVFWTLAIEIAFYAACALLYARGLLGSTRALLLIVGALTLTTIATAIFASVTGRHLPVTLPLGMALMFAGTLMRRGFADGDTDARKATLFAFVLLLVSVPIAELTKVPSSDGAWAHRPLAFIIGVYAAMAVFLVTVLTRFELGRIFAWLGSISFSIYLFHPALMIAARPLLAAGGVFGGLLFAVAVIAATLLISSAVWRWVEAPCIGLGKRLRGGAAGRAGARAQEPAR